MNVYEILAQRQLGRRSTPHAPNGFNRRDILCPHESLVRRLGLQGELEGHGGCVNRLAWNKDGSILASASDDRRIFLWDINRLRPYSVINTEHKRNIFGVRFIPGTGDKTLCSGAMDNEVRVHMIAAKTTRTTDFTCHTDRVKDVQTSEHDHNLFWSASEDSTCRQFDLRDMHMCTQNSGACKNAIVNLNKRIELKGLSINPVFPMYIAFACGDQYLRVYDRRKIEKSETSTMYAGCVEMYAPEHLKNRQCDVHSTYIKYSDDGSQLLGSYHSEHVYLFDTTKEAENTTAFKNPFLVKEQEQKNGYGQHFKEEGNVAFKDSNFTLAISKYSAAILESPRTSNLYSNRAAAYINRGWKSDYHMALTDCDVAISLDSTNIKARYRKAQAFQKLEEFQQAIGWLDDSIKLFPTSTDFPELKQQVENELEAQKENQSQDQYRRRGRFRMGSDDSSSSEAKEEESVKSLIKSRIIQRFTGHCNVKTDIKEANFFGNFIISGSDDGRVFLWEKRTGSLVNILEAADDVVVNCCQPHPHYPILATSGIESVIKLWSPIEENASTLEDSDEVMETNQKNLEAGLGPPIDLSLLHYIRALLANGNFQERSGAMGDDV